MKSINLFPMPDQIVEDNNIMYERCNALIDIPPPIIDWAKEEVTNLDILTHPIEQRTKKWVDGQITQLREQGAKLTYGELEDDIESEIDNGVVAGSSGEAPKSPPIT